MSRCKPTRFHFTLNLATLLTLLIFVAGPVRAADKIASFSFWNWGEELQMQKNGVTEDSNSNFSAMGLEYEYSSGLKNRGWNAAAALLLGQATGGDANGNIVYIASYQQFFGAAAKLNYFWRIERRIYLDVGPILLFRQFTWPESDGTTASSGATFNYGPSATLRIRLSKHLDFSQTIGGLLVKGSTLYATGLGYRF